MEFEFAGGEFSVSENVEVVLPDHMTMLTQAELDRVNANNDSDAIIAIGRVHDGDNVTFMTAGGIIYELDVSRHVDFPTGPTFPIDDGKTVFVGACKTAKRFFKIPSKWLVENAEVVGSARPAATSNEHEKKEKQTK